jgi:hypothetical protein
VRGGKTDLLLDGLDDDGIFYNVVDSLHFLVTGGILLFGADGDQPRKENCQHGEPCDSHKRRMGGEDVKISGK